MLKALTLNAGEDSLLDVLAVANSLHSKSGPFACALIMGDVPSSSDAELKDQEMLLPTYICGGSRQVEGKDNGSFEMNENLTLLNGFGFLKLASGLRVAYMADCGCIGDAKARSQVVEEFERVSSLESCDILLSHDWSDAISARENVLLGQASGQSPASGHGQGLVDQIAKMLKPKYHFSGQNKKQFFELDPFCWDHAHSNGQEHDHVCRFINVAQFKSGSKWAYAFKIRLQNGPEYIPDNLIDNPYAAELANKKRSLEEEESSSSSSNTTTKKKKAKQILPADCRFCLSNSKLNDHMIIAISKSSYLTIAKGPLSTPTDTMNFSGHCLIIPIEHIPKLNPETNQEDANSTTITTTTTFNFADSPLNLDMLRFESSIAEMFFKRFDMSTLVFEINSTNAIHFHKQLLPIPKYLIANFTNALHRQVHLNNEKYKGNAKLEFREYQGFNNDEYLSLVNDPKTNYFQFTIRETATSEPRVFISTFEKDDRIDLQFGRRVAAFLLKQPKRTRWDSKECLQSKQEEEQEVTEFQRAYKEYDFTMQ